MGVFFCSNQVFLVRISIQDLVADGKSLVRNSGLGGERQNLILIMLWVLGQSYAAFNRNSSEQLSLTHKRASSFPGRGVNLWGRKNPFLTQSSSTVAPSHHPNKGPIHISPADFMNSPPLLCICLFFPEKEPKSAIDRGLGLGS